MEPVSIGEGAIVGECCVVLSGAVINDFAVIEPFSVVTQRGIILPPSNAVARLISPEYEREVRFRLAYVEPIQRLPDTAESSDQLRSSRSS